MRGGAEDRGPRREAVTVPAAPLSCPGAGLSPAVFTLRVCAEATGMVGGAGGSDLLSPGWPAAGRGLSIFGCEWME